MAKPAQLLAEIRALPPRTVANVVAGHAVLLAGILWGGLHFVLVQALFAFELILLSVTTMILYPERGLRRHALDTLKMIGGLAFMLFFTLVLYGVASQGDNGQALLAGLQGLRAGNGPGIGWALLYLVVHLGVALWQALGSADPRRAWAQSMLMEGGTTFVALFLMIFVAAFAGIPIMGVLVMLGAKVDAGTVLAALMVATRCALALVVATMPAQERDAIAADPYLD